MMQNVDTEDYNGGDNPDGSASDRESVRITLNTWFLSPYDSFSDSYVTDTGGWTGGFNTAAEQYPAETTGETGARAGAAAIDTNQAFARIDSYTSPDGGTVASHSHYITTTAVTDPETDYSYGNVSGPGTKNGLGSSATAINITFNQSEVDNVLNTGTFTLNETIKKPVPNVAFSPNRQVPLLPAFHKVRYIIKAY
jgi:hypothetical protein